MCHDIDVTYSCHILTAVLWSSIAFFITSSTPDTLIFTSGEASFKRTGTSVLASSSVWLANLAAKVSAKSVCIYIVNNYAYVISRAGVVLHKYMC